MEPPPPQPGSDDGSERARAVAVASAAARAAAAAGVALDDSLLVWRLAGARPRPPADVTAGGAAGAAGAGGPGGAGAAADASAGAPGGESTGAADGRDAADLLAAVLEAATDDGRRRSHGLHVTPRWLADRLVALALPGTGPAPNTRDARPAAGGGNGRPTVCDPACGGGAFLLAAGRRLHRFGVARRDVVRHLLWGADIDPVGLAAAEAALALWAGEAPPAGRLVLADSLAGARGTWPDAPPDGFAAVVGNPPFQSQLARATTRSAADRRRLRGRFGRVLRPYTDTAWLFLVLGCDLVRPGGRVVLVEPQSVVAARDAEAVRAAVGERAVLRDLWVDDGRVFTAAVRVCAPVLERRRDSPVPAGPARAADDPWRRLWAGAVGLPYVRLAGPATVGERAGVLAGFRDQYYGLVGAVRELDPSDPADAVAPLVTSGTLDWAACAWSERPTRFAKRRWRAPVVDLGRLAAGGPPAARRWVERTRAPKLVVATQTRVVEAAVDRQGTWVPSVPAIAVVPADGDDLWLLAAAILSPAATAWLALRAAGTGLDRGSLKVAGPDLSALPLPTDAAAWRAAADALEAYATAPGTGHEALAAYLDAAGRAYGAPDGVRGWWRRQAGTAVRRGVPGG